MNDKMFTQEDLQSAKQITEIGGDVKVMKEDFKDFKTTLKEINNSLPAIRNDVNQALSMAKGAQITADGAVAKNILLEARIEAKANQIKGATSVWKTYLAIVGGLGLTISAIIGIITLIDKIQ